MAKVEQIFEQALTRSNETELKLSQIETVVGQLKFALVGRREHTEIRKEEDEE